MLKGVKRLTDFVLDGVVEEKRVEAEAELKKTVEDSFPEKNPVSKIIITNKFDEVVKELCGDSDYSQVHEYGVAAGKTIHILEDGKLSFCIVFDGKLFGQWIKDQIFLRKAFLIHELNHVSYQNFVWSKIGDSFFQDPQSCADRFRHSASNMWQEYDSNRLVMTIFQEVANNFGGKIHDPISLDNGQQLFDTLNGLTEYASQLIHDYKSSKISLDGLGFQITSRIAQILILWAYTYPASNVVDEVKKKYTDIQELSDFKIIENNIHEIQKLMEELYARRNEYLPELLDRVAEQIEIIIRKFGLKFTDMPNGQIYLSVYDI